MATFVNKNRLMIAHGADISAQMQVGNFERGRRPKDADAWGASTRQQAPGNLYAEMDGSGMTDFSTDGVEQRMDALFGVTGKTYLMSGADGAVADTALVVQGTATQWNAFEVSGSEELFGFAFAVKGSDHFIGNVADKVPALAATADGNGYQLGALTAADRDTLFASIFVLGVPTGTTPTLDAIVQSASDAAFTTPTTRITFSQLTDSTGVTALYARLTPTSDITDDYFRFVFTIGGTTPAFNVITALGVEGPA